MLPLRENDPLTVLDSLNDAGRLARLRSYFLKNAGQLGPLYFKTLAS
jgi:hypothetical protein